MHVQKIIRISVGYKFIVALLILSIFGFCLGAHAIITPETSGFAQLVSSTTKVLIILILSSAISFFVVYIIGLLIGIKVNAGSLLQAATSCVFITALTLLPAAMIVLLFAAIGKYSFMVLFTYAALSIAGMLGCATFAYIFTINNQRESMHGKIVVSFVWLLCFGLSNAEAGWKMRPLIGWTGQSFAIFRSDDVKISSQIQCEVRNALHFGGIKFPKAGEESDTKEWPC